MEIDSENIKSIYYRKIDFPNLEEYNELYRPFIKKEILMLVEGVVNSFEGKVLTKPIVLRKAENKIFQLFLAKKLRMKQPKTVITNNSNYINHSIYNKEYILKPMGMGRIEIKKNFFKVIQTNIVDREVSEIEKCPTYFQEYQNKEYELRITIIDNNIYPVKITNQDKIDWRKSEDQNKYEKCRIPKYLEKECLRFMKELKLKFGAFDYIFDGKDYIFLEVNPNGQWLWLEEKLNLDISSKILNYLK